MWRVLREVDADVYYQRSSAMWTGVIAEFCHRYGKRSIYAGASNMDFVPGEGGQIRYARDRWLYRRGLARVDRIVAQNEAQRAGCRDAYGRDAMVIASCYEPASAVAAGQPRDAVLWVSTIRTGKRPERFLELAARLPHRRFVMVGGPGQGEGEGELYERMQREAAKLGNVELTGFLPLAQVERWLDRARVLVNTSDYEGMPNTFLQAWSRGVPTVAFVDTRSSHEGEPVYDVARDFDHACESIGRLMSDDLAWERASRRVLAHFTGRHSIDSVVGIYESELGRISGTA
jgi:glycosyltransferase involved in cell wall biosynthesis